VDTQGVGLTGISITGDTTISAGQVKAYRAFAQFSDGSAGEVTAQVQWSVLEPHPPSTYFGGNELTAGNTEEPQTISIQAAYAHRNIAGNNSTTARLPVTIQPVPSVGFSYSCCRQVEPFLLWDLSASAKGFSGTITFRWDTDGDGVFDDATGQDVSLVVQTYGRDLVGVKATDDAGHEAVRWQYVSIEKKPVEEPLNQSAVDVLEGSFLSPNGGAYLPDAVKADVGLVVIVHGMCDSASSGGPELSWPEAMGRAIQTRLVGQTPNVCLYDWSEMANPSHFDLGTTLNCNSVETVANLVAIRPYALAHGRILANWLQNEIRLGRARADRPIHIIGHSAGGFVGGECGLVLKRAGTSVAQVTMLDTPHPVRAHFTAYPNPGRVERYISSKGGRFAPLVDGTGCDLRDLIDFRNIFGVAAETASCVVRVSPNSHYYRSEIPNAPPGLTAGHSYAHDWYTANTIDGSTENGFWYSPWLGHSFPANAGLTSPAKSMEPSEAITNFQTFGTVTSTNGVYTVVEEINTGIFKSMAMPIGAQALRFHYRFAMAGDGDFLSVHWGTNALLYVGLDNLMSRENFIEADVPVLEFSGQTNELIFKLVSRGSTNAVLLLDQIDLTISDDPDGDGLTTAQELALGADPLRFDTDADRLSDGDEVNIHHTDPLRRDSDGDGISDLDELTAGTDPLNQNSLLKIIGIRLGTNQTVTLEWQAATNQFYRVNRALTPQRGNFSTRTNGLPGQVPLTTFTEVVGTNAMHFYWVELE
jgi:pimeloyl-ACP methyl ester carboxylesterase